MQYLGMWQLTILFFIIGNVLYFPSAEAETLPPLDRIGHKILHDPNLPFSSVFNSFLMKYIYNKEYFVYLEKIFSDRWEDLFTDQFAHVTQSEPKQLTRSERVIYSEVNGMFHDVTIMRLFCNAAIKWALKGVQKRNVINVILDEAALGQYLANMPSQLKKDLLHAQIAHVLSNKGNEIDTYLELSRYSFYAMFASTFSLSEQVELFQYFNKQLEELEGGYYRRSEAAKSKRRELIIQLRDILYEALGEGQRHKVALYFDIKKACTKLRLMAANPAGLRYSKSTGEYSSCDSSSDCKVKSCDSRSEDVVAQAEKMPFWHHNSSSALKNVYEKDKTTSMSYGRILQEWCPDVTAALRRNSIVCNEFFQEHMRRCSGVFGLSPRHTSVSHSECVSQLSLAPSACQDYEKKDLEEGSNQFLTIPDPSQNYGKIKKIFETRVEVTDFMPEALKNPHLHEGVLYTSKMPERMHQDIERMYQDSLRTRCKMHQDIDCIIKKIQKKMCQNIDRMLCLSKQYSNSELVAAYCAKKAQELGLQFLCNQNDVPDDVYKLMATFIFMQFGFYTNQFPNDPDSVYITNDGITDLLLGGQSKVSSRKYKNRLFDYMPPKEAFRVFSAHYDASSKQATVVVPKEAFA